MNVKHYIDDRLIIFEITEELDHHTCDILRRRMDYEIERFLPKKVLLDFNRVIFMDSAGIGLIIGRYKTVTSLGGSLELVHVKDKLKRIFEMSGIFSIIPIDNSLDVTKEKII